MVDYNIVLIFVGDIQRLLLTLAIGAIAAITSYQYDILDAILVGKDFDYGSLVAPSRFAYQLNNTNYKYKIIVLVVMATTVLTSYWQTLLATQYSISTNYSIPNNSELNVIKVQALLLSPLFPEDRGNCGYMQFQISKTLGMDGLCSNNNNLQIVSSKDIINELQPSYNIHQTNGVMDGSYITIGNVTINDMSVIYLVDQFGVSSNPPNVGTVSISANSTTHNGIMIEL
jgi:hypothetical protein